MYCHGSYSIPNVLGSSHAVIGQLRYMLWSNYHHGRRGRITIMEYFGSFNETLILVQKLLHHQRFAYSINSLQWCLILRKHDQIIYAL